MRDALHDALLAGPLTSRELQARLGLSQPTVSRLLRASGASIATLGAGRATRYGLRRALSGLGDTIAVHRVLPQGQVSLLGRLQVLHGGYGFENLEPHGHSGFFDSLPWFIADMRPQGFLGRAFAQRVASLGLPERLADWSDDHVLIALARLGVDAPGNLLLGDAALQVWSSELPVLLPPNARTARYPELAVAALSGEVPGSSAGGEQPKFTAILAGEPPLHVIVKFSGDLATEVGRRWGDLLIAEHHALTVMRAAGQPAAVTELLFAAGRVFLQVERFDRQGLRGRRGMISLGAFDDQFVGRRQRWLDTAQALARQQLLSETGVRQVAWQQAYAELIANTDRHFGNLSLGFEGTWPATTLPAYDMLPMRDAPKSDGDVTLQPFLPALPAGVDAGLLSSALAAAGTFWAAVAADARVSAEYRAAANERHQAVLALTALVA